jgi:hypothetical protein
MTQPADKPSPDRFSRQAKWRERNPLKRWAHIATASALRRGIISRRPCEVCGAEPAEAHHDDHTNPLKVRWLCRLHHKAEHRVTKGRAV